VREVKRKKVLGCALVCVFLAILATPVMAKPANKVPAVAAITGITGIDPNVEVRFTDDGVGHLAYFMMWGTIDLSLDGGPAIPVEWVDICEGIYSPRSNTGIYRFDEVWTIDGKDAFVGTDHLYGEGNLMDYTIIHTHIVLHGVGDYEGQVLNLWYDSGALIGTWLKP
jgi:hypothetical protein